ncbi:MAG: ubiquinol-cytochrome c reductase iron-sulfur subunit [Cycloclasticus sp.]|uniref:ubiquinol-cytochrome c reductase iron-sulfur subunit n=1 Tax=Haliea salexigens TaxID=287487 RepID=UPI000418E114|nr:ubiquinol-cytochrome c reductase iron-sulfur subunit [Haliea salexigens]MAV30861.1 ubiquinol-cytochrome c reductase iron-sulfur subunit [Cycloclasticus sp.]|tara:strand:+ start:5267 stop:5848 length:582 start_codon:yes stop_codon:yes gene_type:complete
MTEVNEPRRRFLIGATSFVAGAGVVGVATPFVQSWNPSAKAKSVGAPVQVDISKIDPGAMITVAWQGKPVWVVRRTAENLKNLALEEHSGELRDPDSDVNQQPDYARNAVRSIRDDIFVAVGICTHLGCVPNYEPDGRAEVKHALFFCPCHGSKFDLAGRVFKGVPAPTNLIIPPHQYLGNNVLEIGSDATTS